MKLTKRISLLLAIVMVVTTIMTAMPITATAAGTANTATIYNADANGNKNGVYNNMQSKSWSEVSAAINSATANIVVELEGDLTLSSAFNFSTTKTVYVDGASKYTIISGVGNALTTTADANTRNVTFRNVNFTYTGGGCLFQWKSSGTLTYDNCVITSTGNINWGVINMNNTTANTTSNLVVNKSVFTQTTSERKAVSAAYCSCIIRGGNGGTGVKGNITITDSTIDARGARNRSALTLFGHNTVNITNSNILAFAVYPIYVHNGTPTVTWDANSTVSACSSELLDGKGKTAAANIANATVWVETSGTYTQVGDVHTTWTSAVNAANAQLANGNVEIRLAGDVVINLANANGSASTGGLIGAAGGNKLTIVGVGNDIDFVISDAHHAFYPTGKVEFKNLTFYANSSSIVNNNGTNNNVGEVLTFNNVDIYMGAGYTSHVFAYMETDLGSEAAPFELNFKDSSLQYAPGVTNVSMGGGNGVVWCDYRGAHYVNINVENTVIDLSSVAKSRFIYVSWNTNTNNQKQVPLVNTTLTNSQITTVGLSAISTLDQMKSFKIDLDSSVVSNATPIDGAGSKIQFTESVSIDVNGTNYTSWTAALAAANAATTDVTMTLNSNVAVTVQSNINLENGKKLVVDGQGKYTIFTIGVNNVMCPTATSNGSITFKNFSAKQYATGSFVQMYGPVDLTIENVDFFVSNNQRYTVVNALFTNNTKVSNITFKDVTATGHTAGAGADFFRSGNPGNNDGTAGGGNANLIRLVVSDCNFDFSDAISAGGIQISKATTADVFIYNTVIKAAGSKPAVEVSNVLCKVDPEKLPENFNTAKTEIATVSSTFEADIANAVVIGGDNVTDNIYSVEETAPAMQNGASVRLITDSNGIRFTSNIAKAVIDKIAAIADAESISYGTLIVPTGALPTVDGERVFDLDAIKVNVLDIPATAKGMTVGEDGSVTLRAAITDIPEDAIDWDFSAVAYVEFDVDGETYRVYSEYSSENNSRSMPQVAQAALEDTLKEKTEVYIYMDEETGEYSPYSAKQRNILKEYAAKRAD